MLVLTVLAVLPTLLVLALVIDMANWWAHDRALQNKVDAGALAAATAYGGRLPACSTDAALEAEIAGIARTYAGDPTQPGAINVGVNDATRLDVFLNSKSWAEAISDGGGPCHVHADDTRPYRPPDADTDPDGLWVDVKGREADVLPFFGALGVPKVDARAKARVEIQELVEGEDSVPFAVADPAVTPCAWAIFEAAADHVVALERVPGDPVRWRTPVGFAGFTMPLDRHVPVHVKAGHCTDTGQQERYDDLLLVNGWDAGSAPDLRSVTLFGATSGGCPDPYFVPEGAAPCSVGVRAVVQLGPDELLHEVKAVFRTAAGETTTVSLDPVLAGGVWESGAGDFFAVAAGSRRTTVSIRIRPPGCAEAKCELAYGVQQQVVGARESLTGPVEGLSLTPASAYSAAEGTVWAHALELVLDGIDPGDAMVIRGSVNNTENRTGAVYCRYKDADHTQVDTGAPPVAGSILEGCDAFQQNVRSPSLACAPNFWPAGDPVPHTWDCLAGVGGNKTGQIQSAFVTRWGTGSTCVPNHWGTTIELGDPRLVTVFVTAFGANFDQAIQPYPIVSLAHFYVTGWGGDGGDAVAAGCNGANEPYPGDATNQDGSNALWGHFTKFVAPPSGGRGSGSPCDLDGIEACIAVLVD